MSMSGARIYEFIVGGRSPSGPPGVQWVNQPKRDKADPYYSDELPAGSHPPKRHPLDSIGTGFPMSMPTPLFVLDEAFGRLPLTDGEVLGRDIWLISERAKVVFEAIDREAFEFRQVETRLGNGGELGPKYWICDLVRVVDALDEARSPVDVTWQTPDTKFVSLVPGKVAHFKKLSLLGGHIFRHVHSLVPAFCDDDFKYAVESSGLTSFGFKRVGVIDAD